MHIHGIYTICENIENQWELNFYQDKTRDNYCGFVNLDIIMHITNE